MPDDALREDSACGVSEIPFIRTVKSRRIKSVAPAKGANPVIRTSKSTNFDKRFVDFSYLYKLLILSKKGGSGLAV